MKLQSHSAANNVKHGNILKVSKEMTRSVNAIISTNTEGKHQKQSTVNQKEHLRPLSVTMLWLVRCMVSIKDCFVLYEQR